MNYYNEFDKNAAEWIRQLIGIGAIPEGEVDERSITDVQASDLRGFVQCHFFAGIAGWPIALERAGVPADRPLWTGSCPCQSFSCAGKGEGIGSDRDLWPDFFRLIRECRPERVFGEQVEAAVRHGWLDRLSADLEAEGYAVGAVILGAHSAGAPHQRQRLYWVADNSSQRLYARRETNTKHDRPESTTDRKIGAFGLGDTEADGPAVRERLHGELHGQGFAEGCATGGPGDTEGGQDDIGRRECMEGQEREGGGGDDAADVAGATGEGVVLSCEQGLQAHAGNGGDGHQPGRLGTVAGGHVAETGAPGNFWGRAVPIPCRDNCFRSYEPGIFPLVERGPKSGVFEMANGVPRGVVYGGDPRLSEVANDTPEARVMRLLGYGNAICVETARMFIEACEEV